MHGRIEITGNYQYICKGCFLQVYQQENELVNVAKYLKIKFLIFLKLSKLKNEPVLYQKL